MTVPGSNIVQIHNRLCMVMQSIFIYTEILENAMCIVFIGKRKKGRVLCLSKKTN